MFSLLEMTFHNKFTFFKPSLFFKLILLLNLNKMLVMVHVFIKFVSKTDSIIQFFLTIFHILSKELICVKDLVFLVHSQNY